MTWQVIVALMVLFLGSIGINWLQFKRGRKLRDDVEFERERAIRYKETLAKTKELQKKVQDIDQKIEGKKNDRKKMSKSDKLAAANNRRPGA